jgi:hypothetical protein
LARIHASLFTDHSLGNFDVFRHASNDESFFHGIVWRPSVQFAVSVGLLVDLSDGLPALAYDEATLGRWYVEKHFHLAIAAHLATGSSWSTRSHWSSSAHRAARSSWAHTWWATRTSGPTKAPSAAHWPTTTPVKASTASSPAKSPIPVVTELVPVAIPPIAPIAAVSPESSTAATTAASPASSELGCLRLLLSNQVIHELLCHLNLVLFTGDTERLLIFLLRPVLNDDHFSTTLLL